MRERGGVGETKEKHPFHPEVGGFLVAGRTRECGQRRQEKSEPSTCIGESLLPSASTAFPDGPRSMLTLPATKYGHAGCVLQLGRRAKCMQDSTGGAGASGQLAGGLWKNQREEGGISPGHEI